MTGLKKQIVEFLLNKGLVEQPTSSGLCYFHICSKAEGYGQYWVEVKFPNYYANKIEVSTGYTGLSTGDEGYDISSYKGSPKNFEEFLTILEITRFNSQVEKGKNKYIFSQYVADYKG